MGDTTPLQWDSWAWMALCAVWLVAAFFARRTKVAEGWMLRLQHVVPLYVGFFLIFYHRDFGPLAYRVYSNNAVAVLGAMLTFFGVAFAIWARITLGRYWSGNVMLKEGHRLITAGPYDFVRHPIYTGFIVGAFGSALSAARIDAWLGFVIITVSFLFKLRREDALLTREFGEEFLRFKKQIPALFPRISTGAGIEAAIGSDAFSRAALQSDRYRIFAMLFIFGSFGVLDIVSLYFHPENIALYRIGLVWWAILSIYELSLLAITTRAQRRGRPLKQWVWAVNTVIECLLPAVVVLALTGDREYLGPYRALVSSAISVYFLFIILSTLRLSPALCVLAGLVSGGSYAGLYWFTLHVAPHNHNRDFMPVQTYINFSIFLFLAGLLAAGVARQIRQHVNAALAEVETRRKLDRIEYDLKVARGIQMGLLPKMPPTVAGYDIAGFSQPADQTGGDYYDWIELPCGRVLFTIADATGHGIGPALLVAACRAYFRAIANRDEPLERLTEQVDKLIAADVSDGGRFITAALALLDPKTNDLRFYSAGHAPLYLYVAATDEVTMFDADQPPLGVSLGEAGSVARVISLSPGDALVLVTDGFFECATTSGDQLGTRRLGDAIRRHQTRGAKDLIRLLHEEISAFSRGMMQADDLTAVVIRRI